MSFVKLIIRMYNSAHSTAQRWANAGRSINESVLGDRIQIQIEKHKTLAKSRHTAEWTGLEYGRTETQNKVIKWNIKESEGIVIYFGGSFHLTVIWIFLVDFYVFLGFFSRVLCWCAGADCRQKLLASQSGSQCLVLFGLCFQVNGRYPLFDRLMRWCESEWARDGAEKSILL